MRKNCGFDHTKNFCKLSETPTDYQKASTWYQIKEHICFNSHNHAHIST